MWCYHEIKWIKVSLDNKGECHVKSILCYKTDITRTTTNLLYCLTDNQQ